ncbi:MAG: sugar phosphate isomerase/epimerase [Candidatus Brocadiaceae bacterium]|jgi:sugar phosphate isomerase/epimerase
MEVGLLTARFGREVELAEIAAWAGEAGFSALEVTTGPGGHVRSEEVLDDGGVSVKALLEETGLRISSLACYAGFNRGEGPEAYQQTMTRALETARLLGVDTVCTLVGFPAEGKTKEQTIREVAPDVIGPLAEEARQGGIRIAFENWFATNLQNLEHFRAVTEAFPHPNVGFNFDPSHLHWQGIDVVGAVAEFADRIFHTHAKDVSIDRAKLSRLGVLAGGWWEYSIPGYGEVPWGPYIRALRRCGYDGVLSIEHEDAAFGAKEGFRKGLRYLSSLI